jgi:hypothetical protein
MVAENVARCAAQVSPEIRAAGPCDRLLASDADAIVREMASYPDVPVSPHNDGPGVMAALRRALERGRYRLRDDAG